MTRWIVILLLVISSTYASNEGEAIYLHGVGSDGVPLKAFINDLEAGAALACVNCHRESGLGTSESGQTIPPVSWRFLGRDQPENDQSRFYSIQNKRPAYDMKLFHRLLTSGVNSKGEQADKLMPRYHLTAAQSKHLVTFLKQLYSEDDPGVDAQTIHIATIIDGRLPAETRLQHGKFLQSLFDMKNSLTRGEIKRKNYSPIQKVPQYESYRKWNLQLWELSSEPESWRGELQRYYDTQRVFVVLAPLVSGDYSTVQAFCRENKTPCLFPGGAYDSAGDYYSFVYRDSRKQQKDFLISKARERLGKVLYFDEAESLRRFDDTSVNVPLLGTPSATALKKQFIGLCEKDYTLVLLADIDTARDLHGMDCPTTQLLKIVLLADPGIEFEEISELVKYHSNPNICWATDYDRVLQRNSRKIRVDVLARKFAIENANSELLAKNLYAFGLLADSMHQLAGNFSRPYLMENVEHMLNSYPNYTYYSKVAGAPNQRSIVGSLKEFCAGGRS